MAAHLLKCGRDGCIHLSVNRCQDYHNFVQVKLLAHTWKAAHCAAYDAIRCSQLDHICKSSTLIQPGALLGMPLCLPVLIPSLKLFLVSHIQRSFCSNTSKGLATDAKIELNLDIMAAGLVQVSKSLLRLQLVPGDDAHPLHSRHTLCHLSVAL
jgi:hypothetical protein